VKTARIAVVGIGNTMAGDDGVGIVVADRLAERWEGRDDILVTTLEGDLFAVSDRLDRAREFLFVDAIAGDPPGQIRFLTSARRAFAASMHQTDIGTVMQSLENLGIADPFPGWRIWGITIEPPEELGEGLSPAIAAAADELVGKIIGRVEGLLAVESP
jgi:hydrogenase maturation protease